LKNKFQQKKKIKITEQHLNKTTMDMEKREGESAEQTQNGKIGRTDRR